MIGTVVANFKILEKLGEGGMGVVYKAEDIKLKRTVALKFLSHHISASEEERARFLQEAQAIATMNHPNVCTLYGLEEHDGQQFLEMEFVDGTTLRERMHGAQMKIDEAIDYAIQIGDALHEAHDKGIVHRDVKAENIMVNGRNQIKVMDFGLAKLKGALKLTRASSTIGTLAYMAPEQIRGEEIDARSDIFSLGVVLYELLTGRTPFRGEHDAAIMYSILNEDPEPPQNIRPDLPPELVHVIENSLEKDPEERYQTADEVVRELRRIRKHSSRVSRKQISEVPAEQQGRSESPATPAPTAPQPIAPPERTGIPVWVKAGLGVVVIVAVAFVAWQVFKPAPHLSQNMVFKPLSIPFRTIWYPGISADGNWIAFPATDENNVTELYFMNAAGGDPKALTNDSLFKYTADISPDGSQIAFSKVNARTFVFGGQRSLWTVSTLGGVQKKIAENGVGARWSPDGKSISFLTGDGNTNDLAVINADGSNKRIVLRDSLPPGGSRVSADWSPDGENVAWLRGFRGAGGVYQEIIIKNLASGEERQLTSDKKNIDEVTWTTAGFVVFSSNRGGATNLWAISEKGGEPVQVTKGPGPDISVRVSRNAKRVLYLQQAQFGALRVGDASGLHSLEITPGDQSVYSPKFSADGKLVAYVANDPDPIKAATSIYIVGADGKDRHRLLQTSRFINFLRWSPDGSKIAYDYADSVNMVAVVDVADPGREINLGEGGLDAWLDGATLSIQRNGSTWKVPLRGDQVKISPDSVMFNYSQSAKKHFVVDIHGGKRQWMIPDANGKLSKPILDGRFLGWLPDDKTVGFFRNGEAWLLDPGTGKTWKYPWQSTDAIRPSDISVDAKSTVFVKNQTISKLILIDDFIEE